MAISNKKGHYICECGKEFEWSQQFNGHKRHCACHLIATGKSEKMKILDEQQKQHRLKTLSTEKIIRKKAKETQEQAELEKWISEKHTCERCGKIMVEKFGPGRFCSRTCANSRPHTEESKKKTSESLKTHTKQSSRLQKHRQQVEIRKAQTQQKYAENPNYCKSCGKPLPWERRNFNTCGAEECIHSYRSYKCKLAHKEGRNKGWINRKTVSYPERFWLRVLDNNNIQYEKQFKVINSATHKYYFLDFLVNGKIDLEIDGRQHQREENKIRDAERDIFVKSLGYIVYRIPWYGLSTESKKEIVKNQIEEFLQLLKHIGE